MTRIDQTRRIAGESPSPPAIDLRLRRGVLPAVLLTGAALVVLTALTRRPLPALLLAVLITSAFATWLRVTAGLHGRHSPPLQDASGDRHERGS